MPITYVSYEGWEVKDQFDVVIDKGSFVNPHDRNALCTYVLKTKPFMQWLDDNFKDKDCIIYYGFDKKEKARIARRSSILASSGYKSDYPLALWTERTINSTDEIGIDPPMLYKMFKHANCIGCLKAGRTHWYIVYCKYPQIFEKAKFTENEIGHSIMKDYYLEELEPLFLTMKNFGVKATEHMPAVKFWKDVKKIFNKEFKDIEMLKQIEASVKQEVKPCECFI